MTSIDQTRLEEITGRTIGYGAHDDLAEGMCVMEAVAYVAGEDWTDHPACASPTIASFLRSWNDGLPDDETRTRLLSPLIPRLVGTASTAEVQPTVEELQASALDLVDRMIALREDA